MTHPPINFEKLPPVDLERYERALEYRPKSIGPGQYVVYFAPDPLRQEHHVDLESSDVPRCDCGDFLYREQLCKHILACLIHIKHPVAQETMVAWLASKRGKPCAATRTYHGVDRRCVYLEGHSGKHKGRTSAGWAEWE